MTDYYAHGDGDVRLCPDCDEPVQDWTCHPSCCGHEATETTDEADGVAGGGVPHLLVSRCVLCGSEVFPAPSGDGGQEWVLA